MAFFCPRGIIFNMGGGSDKRCPRFVPVKKKISLLLPHFSELARAFLNCEKTCHNFSAVWISTENASHVFLQCEQTFNVF